MAIERASEARNTTTPTRRLLIVLVDGLCGKEFEFSAGVKIEEGQLGGAGRGRKLIGRNPYREVPDEGEK